MVVAKRSDLKFALEEEMRDLQECHNCGWLSESQLSGMDAEVEAELDQLCDQML